MVGIPIGPKHVSEILNLFLMHMQIECIYTAKSVRLKHIFETKSVKTSLNDQVVKILLITHS